MLPQNMDSQMDKKGIIAGICELSSSSGTPRDPEEWI